MGLGWRALQLMRESVRRHRRSVNPSSYLQHYVLAQLDAFAVNGLARVMGAFANIADEADDYANKMFESYAGVGDPGDFADEAVNQGASYYSMLADLRQSMLNLLAVGLYHLYEQHRDKLTEILAENRRVTPRFDTLPGWQTIEELRLVANTVKHADGGAAKQLRERRPDLFVAPILRGSSLEKHVLARATETPLGGTDLFVSEEDLTAYRDALREHWEALRPQL